MDVSRPRTAKKKLRAGTIYLPEAHDQNLNKTENVSPYSVQNLTGYPITILPSEKSMKLELLEDETKDIRFEKSVEELFSTQSERNPFSHQKISLLINYPEALIPRSDGVVLDETAVKDVFFPPCKGITPQVFCDIQDRGKKRVIIFTTSVQITNEFNVTFEVMTSHFPASDELMKFFFRLTFSRKTEENKSRKSCNQGKRRRFRLILLTTACLYHCQTLRKVSALFMRFQRYSRRSRSRLLFQQSFAS